MGRRRNELTIKSEETSIILGLLSIILAVLLLLSTFVTAPAFDLFRKYIGISSIVGFFLLLNVSLRSFGVEYAWSKKSALFGQLLTLIDISGLLYLLNPDTLDKNLNNITGSIGKSIGILFSDIFSKDVGVLLLFALLFLFVPLALNLSFVTIKEIFVGIGNVLKKIFTFIGGLFKKKEGEEEEVIEDTSTLNTMMSDLHPHVENVEPVRNTVQNKPVEKPRNVEDNPQVGMDFDATDGNDSSKSEEKGLINQSLNYPNWVLPPLDLLDQYKKIKPPIEGIKKNSQIIEQTLQSFGITAKVIDVKVGPTVTQYAVNIALGTKVAKIANLKNDLALALATRGDIRIEAPIPGTSYVGIEFANPISVVVQIRELMEHLVPLHKSLGLGVVIGKAIDGSAVTTDIQKAPHVLVAGTTGSGKSVLTNTFITSLLMTRTPDEVRFILVDPKQVEFSDYNGIPHLLTPVIVDVDQVLNALKWAVAEMDRRYTIFRQARVRNLIGYNQLMGFSALPYIVIVIDEMADLMLSLGRDLETQIVKLAQKARATGIHLILATQRPSVDVITGLIKANIPTRVGLKVATQIDSRVILDSIGAESLLGKGDLLLVEPDKSKPQRVQAVWLSQGEVQKVVDYIKKQVGDSEIPYLEEVTAAHEDEQAQLAAAAATGESNDNMMVEAVKIVMQAKKGSASLLQRRLSIGYNRAARLLDEMQEMGIVTVQDGSKPRDVVMSIAENYITENSAKST
jgi:DNA segregation ATPase FtsK/SpoIIIE-like protein